MQHNNITRWTLKSWQRTEKVKLINCRLWKVSYIRDYNKTLWRVIEKNGSSAKSNERKLKNFEKFRIVNIISLLPHPKYGMIYTVSGKKESTVFYV